jgi:hypothetical protein
MKRTTVIRRDQAEGAEVKKETDGYSKDNDVVAGSLGALTKGSRAMTTKGGTGMQIKDCAADGRQCRGLL